MNFQNTVFRRTKIPMIPNYRLTFLQSFNKNKHVFDNLMITEASVSYQCRIKIHSFKPHFSKIEECLKEEEEKTEVIAVKTKLNEEVCVRCCQKFGIIFNRKQLCLVCKHYVCKRCADYNDSEKGYTCHACIKERSGNYLINNWCRKIFVILIFMHLIINFNVWAIKGYCSLHVSKFRVVIIFQINHQKSYWL